jgi:hypothetical protein
MIVNVIDFKLYKFGLISKNAKDLPSDRGVEW